MRILLGFLFTFVISETCLGATTWCKESAEGFDSLLKVFSEEYNSRPDIAIHKIKELNCPNAQQDAVKRLQYVVGFIQSKPFQNPLEHLPKPWIRDSHHQIVVDPQVKKKLLSSVAACQSDPKHCELEKFGGGQSQAFKMGDLFLKQKQNRELFDFVGGRVLRIATMVYVKSRAYLFDEALPRHMTNSLSEAYIRIRDHIAKNKISGVRIPLIEIGWDSRFPNMNYEIAQNLSDEGTSFDLQKTKIQILDLYQAMELIPSLRLKIQEIFNNFTEVVYYSGLSDMKRNNVILGWGGISIVDFDQFAQKGKTFGGVFAPNYHTEIRALAHWSLFEGMRKRLEKIKDKDLSQNYSSLGELEEIKQKLLSLCKSKAWSIFDLKLESTHCPSVSSTLEIFAYFADTGYQTSGDAFFNTLGLESYLKGLSEEQISEVFDWFQKNFEKTFPKFSASYILQNLLKVHREVSSENARRLLQSMEKFVKRKDCDAFFDVLESLDRHFVKRELIQETKHVIDLLSENFNQTSGCGLRSSHFIREKFFRYLKNSKSAEITQYLSKTILEKHDVQNSHEL